MHIFMYRLIIRVRFSAATLALLLLHTVVAQSCWRRREAYRWLLRLLLLFLHRTGG